MARMAARHINNAAQRNALIDSLAEVNLRRVLHPSVLKDLEERILSRSRAGNPPLTTPELERECIELERRREDRKALARQSYGHDGNDRRRHTRQVVANVKPNKLNKAQFVRQATEAEFSESDSSPESSDGEAADSENEFEALINEIRYQKKKYQDRGHPVDDRKLMKRATRNINRRFAGRQPGNAKQVVQDGPPSHLKEEPRKTISELLTLANCVRGECILCGKAGHIMSNDACGLRGKPLTSSPCVKCKKGLHAADDCPRVYQQGGNPGNISQILLDALNEF
jgi:hypothetical protein